MNNVADFSAHRQLRELRKKLADVNAKIDAIRIIWSELTEEERKDPTTLRQVQSTLTKAHIVKGKALYAIQKIEAQIKNAI